MLEQAKQEAQWGTLGISGKEPVQHKHLVSLTTEHLQAILATQPHIRDIRHRGYTYELLIREILSDRAILARLEPTGSWVNA